MSDVSRRTSEGTEVRTIVSPRSGRSGLDGFDEWRRRLVVRVRAPPLDGRANKEVEALFEGITGMPSEIISGHTGRQKTVLVRGDPETAEERIQGSL